MWVGGRQKEKKKKVEKEEDKEKEERQGDREGYSADMSHDVRQFKEAFAFARRRTTCVIGARARSPRGVAGR